MSIKKQLETLPQAPGVYIYKDKSGHVLYVGKAKFLRTRVRSYFRANANLDPAKRDMVTKVANIETIVVNNENEALMLEANLIRKHQPPYNVVLRDDKYYLFIKIVEGEDGVRIFPIRKVKKDGARYFGPYSSAKSVRETLKLLRRIFGFKTEKDSPREQVFKHPLFKDILIEKSSRELVIDFLKGSRREITERLQAGMKQAAQQKNYEQAAIFRDQLNAIERLEGSQKVVLNNKEDFDVVSIATENSKSAANIFQIRSGKLLGKQTFLLNHRSQTTPADILRQFLLQYYQAASDIPKTIFVPEALPDQEQLSTWLNQKEPVFSQPQRGVKKQLQEMGELNAKQLLQEERADFEQDARLKRAAKELAQALGIKEELKRIETYDISNTQGKLPTASMVVFTNAKPDKAQYRKFKLEREETPNDFAAMQEVLRRRFSGKHEDWKIPNLVLIDGGKGQLSSAQKILEELDLPINLASIAKREEELFVPGRKTSIRLPYDSDALYLVQRMRDEAHRFTINYHKLLRSKKNTRSILDEIPGIGPKMKKELLNKFGSLKNIRAASDDELVAVIGQKKLATLRDYI